jgi:hypothetical protein
MKDLQECDSALEVARLVRRCLEQGSSVEIERLGTFRPKSKGGYEFVPLSLPNVFISYVEEDYAIARRLYAYLKQNGFTPWLDRKNLLPGQNWPRAIERTIETSDFFLACLSTRSVRKRGSFQSELRWALECARRLPLDDVFVVPVRLEECRVPCRIQQQLQYVDLFPAFEKGAARVAAMLRKEWTRRSRG